MTAHHLVAYSREQGKDEQHAEQDKQKLDEIETVSKADTLVYTTEKTLKDVEGKVEKKEIEEIKGKIDELKKLLEPEKKDIAALKKKIDGLNEIAQQAMTAMYQKVAAEQQAKQQKGAQGPQEKKEKVVEGEVVDEEKK